MPLRVIPILLISDGKLVKTKKFRSPTYVGDPINAVKVFNEKEVDEIIILDVQAGKTRKINHELLYEMASECFMPITYGGGISTLKDIQEVLNLGIERVAINTYGLTNFNFIQQAVQKFGSSTIVCSVDFKKKKKDYIAKIKCGRVKLKNSLAEIIKELDSIEVGELLINSIDNDGCMQGYDLNLLSEVLNLSQIPVTIAGGAGSIKHFKEAVDLGVSAVAAGSYFVFWGPLKAVLINYPNKEELISLSS